MENADWIGSKEENVTYLKTTENIKYSESDFP